MRSMGRDRYVLDSNSLKSLARRFGAMNIIVGIMLLSFVLLVACIMLEAKSLGIGLLLGIAALQVCLVIAICLTIDALGLGVGWMLLTVFSLFLPIVPLIVLVAVNNKAKESLRAGGYEIGLFGAKSARRG